MSIRRLHEQTVTDADQLSDAQNEPLVRQEVRVSGPLWRWYMLADLRRYVQVVEADGRK